MKNKVFMIVLGISASLLFCWSEGCSPRISRVLGGKQDVLSIEQLAAECLTASGCDQPLLCQDSPVRVWGFIDYANVFDHQRFPQLPYEKFVIRDGRSGRSLEVWVQAGATESKAIFRQIRQWAGKGPTAVILSGKVQTVKLFSRAGCKHGIKLIIGKKKHLELLRPDN